MDEKKIETVEPQETEVVQPQETETVKPQEEKTEPASPQAEKESSAPKKTKTPKEPKEIDPRSSMRKKILILVLLLLCVGGLVAVIVVYSGIPIVDFWTVAGSFDPVETEMKSIEKIEGVSGNREDSKGALALYSATDANGKKTQTVVHLLDKKVLASVEDSADRFSKITLFATGEAAWYSVVTTIGMGADTRYSIALYDESGKSFAERDNLTQAAYRALPHTSVLDLVRLGQDVFRVASDGTVALAFTMDAFATLPDFDSKVEDHYFVLDANACYVYNEKAVLTATYHVPSGAINSEIFILSDGTLLAQYVTYEGENAENYTYAVEKSRYKLHHVLVSARNGAQTEMKNPEFFIISVISDEKELHRRGLNTGIANLARGYYVKDSLLDKGAHALSSVLMSNRGRITSEVADIIPAMYGGELLGVAKNRWVAKNLAGERFLLNEWGAVIGRFPDETSEIRMAASLFVCDSVIYNWNLEPIYNMRENGVLRYELVGSSVVMYKENGETLLFDPEEGEAKQLTPANTDQTVSVLGSALISVATGANGNKQYAFYNEHKELLLSVEATDVRARSLDADGKRTVELLVTSGFSTSLYIATVED